MSSTAQPDSNATRASLLSRARERNSEAWCELVDLYGPLVAHWCYRCGLDSHSAADCVQDTFAAVLKSLGQFQSRRTAGAFRGWLWTIAANKIRDHQRSRRRHVDASGGSTALQSLAQIAEPDMLPDTEPTDPQQLSELVSRAMQQVRNEFESRSWEIFIRLVVDQMQTGIVAEEFHTTPAAVRQIRSRVLRRLRQHLGDLES